MFPIIWLSHIHIPQYLVILPQSLQERLPNFEPLQCALAGVELTVLPAAGTVLCFGFSVRIILITHGLLAGAEQFALSQALFSFSHCPARAGWGNKKLGGDTARAG